MICVAAQIGKGRLYTPFSEDVGSVLKVEVVVIESSFGVPREAGYTFSVSTTRVKVRRSPSLSLCKQVIATTHAARFWVSS